jgi:prolyl 3-hydroxylase /prolyl 3,4-dihydroxylase
MLEDDEIGSSHHSQQDPEIPASKSFLPVMKRKAEETLSAPSSKKVSTSSSHEACFRSDLFNPETQSSFATAYRNSKPYPHAVVPSLIQDELLRNVRKEITEHVHFTLKETDIYRIHQSGDLANLSRLAADELKHLPSLVTLRDALYSSEFRAWVSAVTGAGKVSGTKTDMAVNVYTPGSYLLCHDDVIGSRRVSYILYLTDPDEPWQSEWGGGLRLYPTEVKRNLKGEELKVPLPEHTLNIPPSFGQLSFFAVRPGESYHDVEEVYHGSEGKRIRVAISGWYHIPQEGEDGYEEGAEAAQAQRSSLAQLKGTADEFDEPRPDFVDLDAISTVNDRDILTEEELTFLLDYITPQYLTPDMSEKFSTAFIQDSVIQLEGFLRPSFADKVEKYIKEADSTRWSVARPPHKHRFQFLQRKNAEPDSPFSKLTAHVLLAPAFRKWLALITGIPSDALRGHSVVARHFRKGKDYALASTYRGEDPRLEYTIGLTPDAEKLNEQTMSNNSNSSNGENKGIHIDTSLENSHGGEEIYMAGEDDDTASTTSKSLPQVGKKATHDPAVYKTGEEDEDDAILFTDTPSWNTLSVVMRDQGTLRFVKYVSEAGRDRWDVKGEVVVDAEMDENNDEIADERHLLENAEDDVDEDFDGDSAEDGLGDFSSSDEEEEENGV